MIVLKNTTKKALGFIRAYRYSSDYSLRDVYSTYSDAKANAEVNCLQCMERDGGYRFKIISRNTFGFTCGYKVRKSDDSTTLIVHTPSNVYSIDDIYNVIDLI